MVLDIIIVAVIVLMTILGYKRGIVNSLYGLIVIAAAGFLSYLCGRILAELIYNNFILSSITDSVSNSFGNSKTTADSVSTNLFGALPDYLSNILIGFGVTQKGFTTTLESASDFSQNAVLAAVDKVIKPIVVSAISVFIIIILFILFVILLKILGRYILKIFKLPGIRWLNSLFGGVFGFAEGALIVFIFVVILKIASAFSNSLFISKEMIDSSHIFKALYYMDFMSFVSNINGS